MLDILMKVGNTAGDTLFVCIFGILVVFLCLACIIGVIELLTLACNKIFGKEGKRGETHKTVSAPVIPTTPAPSTVIENRDEVVAAICTAIAEETGTDISAIRVVSIKRV